MKIVRFDSLPYVPAGHEDAEAPGVWKKVLFERQDIAGERVQMVNWARLPAGSSFRRHYHEDMEELFVIVKGRARITVDGESTELAPGDGVTIPAGARHVMEALGGEDVEYLAVGVSPGAGGRTVVA